jgi:putative ABC transport system permease protein
MFRFLPLMFKNTMRNRRRSVLTIGSVAVSLCILGVLMAMYHALFMADPTPSQALRLVVRHRVSLTVSMPASYEQKIQQVPGVKDLMIWDWFGGTYKDSRDPKNFFARFGTEPDKVFLVHPEYQIPEDEKQAFLHQRTGFIVSSALAKKMGFKLGDRITLLGDIYPVNLELTLVGIFVDPDDGEVLYYNRQYLREALGAGNARADMLGAFQILANSADDVPRIAKTVDAMFDNAPAPTRTESESAFALSFVGMLGNIKVFLMAICSAVAFTILLVTANTISMSVRERIREVGIMKTLGYTPDAILGIILGESAVISLIGGAIGCAMAAFLCLGVRSSPAGNFAQGLKLLSLTPPVALLCLGIALLIGVVSSLVPAWGASRTSILESLRSTG